MCGLEAKNRRWWLTLALKGCRPSGSSSLPSVVKDADGLRVPCSVSVSHLWEEKHEDDGEQTKECLIWGALCHEPYGKGITFEVEAALGEEGGNSWLYIWMFNCTLSTWSSEVMGVQFTPSALVWCYLGWVKGWSDPCPQLGSAYSLVLRWPH